jgi:hypothetical protein
VRATSNEVVVTDDWPEAIWVAVVCSRSVVHRIDPVTDRIVARIALPGRAGFSGVALGFGAVWAAPSGQVVRIDSATNRIVAASKVADPPVDFNAITTGVGAIWVGDDRTQTLLRIEPRASIAPAAGRLSPLPKCSRSAPRLQQRSRSLEPIECI